MLAQSSMAGPWLDAGDQRLRHDIQMLADAGLIHLPMQSWPLQAADIDLAVGQLSIEDVAEPALRRALTRVRGRVRRESRAGRWRTHLAGAIAANPESIRSFNNKLREDGEAEIGAEWMGQRFATRIQGQWINDPDDGDDWRLDGSYAAAIMGNWGVSIDTMDRWWGPGWDGSLILSNNARSFPKLAVQRNYSEPADLPVLSWLGPWRYIAFLGILDDQHAQHSQPLLFGHRFESAPLPSLQLGLSSTVMFGGGDRGENLGSLVDVYLGEEDDDGDNPGYQITAVDARWKLPFIPLAVYGQYAGQSEKGSFADEDMQLYGAETWFNFGTMGHSLRLQIEYADLGANDDGVYANDIYPDGYTNYGHSIGHAFNIDSGVAGELSTLTLTWVTPEGSTLHVRGRDGERNEPGGTQQQDYSEVQFGYEHRLADDSHWSFDLGWRDFSGEINNDDGSEWYGAFLIRRNF
ncbi:capsule assembly Wzi family protein [Halorhodospira halochloris]|uniref:capsule assembly Wzi family protein n=1 Tax=Halorhodospira halochloris TaxID=1052 RepID=UPI001EE832D0|nr:capsule assembly Wzi family protein [Halorhodospira halochloris]MCG5549108.1 capsule assembly Wzi family protein [Halorhodospira halochloris]